MEDKQTAAVIGAAIEVARALGTGFRESVYQEALELELQRQGVPYEREVATPIQYKGAVLGSHFRADFICFDDVIVELKAQRALGDPDLAQVLHYLHATRLRRGLLLNFGERPLGKRRVSL